MKKITSIPELKSTYSSEIVLNTNNREILNECINIDISNPSFGRELAWKYPKVIKTDFGTMASLWTAISYCTHKGFPYELTNKDPTKINSKKREAITRNKVNVENYWSIVADLTGKRLLGDRDLIKKLAESNKKLTSYISKPVIMFGKSIDGNVIRVNSNMLIYLLILAYYRDLYRNNMFNIETITEFANNIRDNTNIGIYDGVKEICINNYKNS